MPRFRVPVVTHGSYAAYGSFEVEADTIEEAIEKAEELLVEGDPEDQTFNYSPSDSYVEEQGVEQIP